MLQVFMVFHEACLYAYLSSDRVVPGPGRELYEKRKELKNWVIEQEWDGVVLEKTLDRVLEKMTKMMEEKAEEVQGGGEMVKLKEGLVVM